MSDLRSHRALVSAAPRRCAGGATMGLTLLSALGIAACDDAAARARMRREAEAAVARALADARTESPTAQEPAWGTPVTDEPTTTWDKWRGQPVDPQPALTVVEGLSVVPMFAEPEAGLLGSAIREGSRVSLARLSAAGVAPSRACGAGTPVQVYQWPERSLPRDHFLPRLQLPAGEVLLGTYHPVAVDSSDAIVVHSGEANAVHEVLVHEFAHYWYERACGARTLQESSEDFAQAVQADAARWRPTAPEYTTPAYTPPEDAPPRHVAGDGLPLDGVVVSTESVLLQVDGPIRLEPGSRVRVTVEETDGRRCRRRGLFRRWKCE